MKKSASPRSGLPHDVVEALVHLFIQWGCLDYASLAHLARGTPIDQIDLKSAAGIIKTRSAREVCGLIAKIDGGANAVSSVAARMLPRWRRLQRQRVDVRRITAPLLLLTPLVTPAIPWIVDAPEVSTISARNRRWLVHHSQRGIVAGRTVASVSQVYPGSALGIFDAADNRLTILKAATSHLVRAIPIGLTGDAGRESFLWVAGTNTRGVAHLSRYHIGSGRLEAVTADPTTLFSLQGVRDVDSRTIAFRRTPTGWLQYQLFGAVFSMSY